MTDRRRFLRGAATVALAAAALPLLRPGAAAAEGFAITRSDAEWREMLTPWQYAVLRDHATERPFTSPLNGEKRAGIYHCAGCDQALYDAATKFDSGTGWPSFWQEIPGSVGTARDVSFLGIRTEVHCGRCGGHLGHVFDDGPPPTGLRHCINGVALTFRPVGAA
jgi:peptide-methionine (R)-S-oxide reductase